MATIQDHIDFQTLLQTAVAPRQSFGLNCFLVDDEQIPIDARYLIVTPTSWDDDLDSGTDPYDYANAYFGQSIKAEQLMLGRWASANTNPLFICGSGYEKSFAVWAAETTASFAVTDGTNTDDITGLTFAGITALEQILAILDAGLAAVGAPTVTGLNTFSFEFDTLGRLVLRSSQSGVAADSIWITTAGSGSDISEPLMDASNGTVIAGLDAEDPEDALQAISAINDSYYAVTNRGASAAQQLALSTYIQAQEKLLVLAITDANAKDPLSTTDVPYQLQQLTHRRTLCIYTEHTDEFPDAAALGNFLPAEEGSKQIEWQALALVSDSGNPTPLIPTARQALINKNCSAIETVSGITYLYDGLTSGNVEFRIMLARDWFVARNREDIFTYQIQTPLAAFDNETLTALESIIWKNANEAIDRRILVNTPERPFTVTLPDADDIDQATRATHKLTVLDAFSGYLNSAIHDYRIVGTWTI